MSGLAPLLISLLGLVVALLTLYFSLLRPPRISMVVNDTLGALCFKGGFGFQIPLTFVNTAPTAGTVIRCSLVLHKVNQRTPARHILWYDFRFWDATVQKWMMETLAGALVIPGRSAITKNVYFYWDADDEMPFDSAEYMVIFCAWRDHDMLPSLRSSHRFVVSQQQLALVVNAKLADVRSLVDFTLIDSFQRNETMTDSRLKTLLGL
jgi:hypothetical protein